MLRLLTLAISHLVLVLARFPTDPCDDWRNVSRGLCTFYVGADDTPLTSYQFSQTGNTNLSILALADCELTVVAVGGGGYADIGGGGSGYVVRSSLPVLTSALVVRVGGRGETSSLQTTDGETVIAAPPGGNGNYYDGGAGYSGGGGGSFTFRGGDGGADGGDGTESTSGEPGGAGSRLDITSLSSLQFSLSPGLGGKGSGVESGGEGGGGGGGVMVGGSGPQETVYDGQGYGGGGSYQGGHPGPGLVLLEIKLKQ